MTLVKFRCTVLVGICIYTDKYIYFTLEFPTAGLTSAANPEYQRTLQIVLPSLVLCCSKLLRYKRLMTFNRSKIPVHEAQHVVIKYPSVIISTTQKLCCVLCSFFQHTCHSFSVNAPPLVPSSNTLSCQKKNWIRTIKDKVQVKLDLHNQRQSSGFSVVKLEGQANAVLHGQHILFVRSGAV